MEGPPFKRAILHALLQQLQCKVAESRFKDDASDDDGNDGGCDNAKNEDRRHWNDLGARYSKTMLT